MHKVGGVGVVNRWELTFGLVFCLCGVAGAQTLPEDELQVNFSGYFDSFDVAVVYPSIALTKKVSQSTSLTGRYLVDMVSAASIKDAGGENSSSLYQRVVDVVTSASGREERPQFDDVRQEAGFGITQMIAGQMLSINGIYGRENDYSSATLAGSYTQWLAKKNTSVQVGFVRSWDEVFPVTKDWRRKKDVIGYSANLSQVLSPNIVVQMLGSYTTESGYMADAYQQISIGGDTYDAVHPDRRIRKAAAGRIKFRLTSQSSMQLGYRYYWDDWKMKSHTGSINYKRYLSSQIILGLGLRSYFQNRAFFFQPSYDQVEEFMTADIKLDSGFTNELQFDLTIHGGGRGSWLTFFKDDRLQYHFNVSLFQRHSSTPYWFNNSKDMISTDFNFGIRIRL